MYGGMIDGETLSMNAVKDNLARAAQALEALFEAIKVAKVFIDLRSADQIGEESMVTAAPRVPPDPAYPNLATTRS